MSNIVKMDTLEAKCRFCGTWCSNRVARSYHEAKHHMDDTKRYKNILREPGSKRGKTKKKWEEMLEEKHR